MRHHVFRPADSYSVALLSKASAFDKQALQRHYVEPLDQRGVWVSNTIAFTLEYEGKKVSTAFAKEYLAALMPELRKLGVRYLLVADAGYFKLLTKQAKAESHLGYAMPCMLEGYEDMHVVLTLNYQQLIYNPELQSKLNQSLDALASHFMGAYQAPGTGIIKKAVYPESVTEIKWALTQLMEYPELTCDIETFSLDFWEAGIGTISFAIDEHHGVAFCCDWQENVAPVPLAEKRQEFGRRVDNLEVRALLKRFFEAYQGKLTFHNAGFDAKVLVYELWMKSLLDTAGMLEGIEVLTRSIDDTKIIIYLATNTTAGNVLGLKPRAQEFAGNYAVEDIKDIKLVPKGQLLQYNLVDALSTWYVKKKYWPIMVADNQLNIYQTMMLPSLKLILQIELTGMPMGRDKIQQVKGKLEAMRDQHEKVIMAHSLIPVFEEQARVRKWEKDYQDRKKKAKNPDKIQYKDLSEFPRFEFNPNSGKQLQEVLYELMGLPVIDYTDTKQPATGAETLEKLINHTSDPQHKTLLESLIKHGQVQKILSTFIPAFERAIAKADDGIVWLHGSFNIGGTVSGRLSSSDPNLQNIPAKSILADYIKECFYAPPGMLFVGADFNSLEDYISALTTKDKNKLAVYERGYDGHCLRAAYYFKEELIAEGLNIDVDDPKSVNTIKKLAEHWRQESKAPTFLLTYGGTYHGMMSNLGWDKEKSQRIEANYHELYKESDAYVARRLKQANIDGYVDVAFGLRLRTPLIKQVIWNGPKMPYEAAAEGRTAGNALGQSYGLLNNRAAIEFMDKVWASEYRLDIWPVALIHDAAYLVIKEDPAVVEWVNRELIKSMQWQELPEIQHPTVKLGAALDIYWPHWGNPITLPNGADQQTIIHLCREARNDYLYPKEKKAA